MSTYVEGYISVFLLVPQSYERYNRNPMVKKILLVEDEALIAMAEAQILKKQGFDVVTVYNGEKAIEAVEADPDFSLILMDIDLGKGRINGPAAAQEILNKKDIPIVFLSSHTEPEMVETTEGITSYGYIVKNSGETVLLASIKMAFRLFEARMKEREHKEALLHSHDLMSYIIEHNQSAVAVHDKDLKYIYVSKQYLNQYNVEKRDVIGKHHYEVFPDLPQKWREVHKKALAGEVSKGEDDPYEHEDGTIEWTRWECRPWHETDGSIGGFIIYTEVISKERQAKFDVRDNINYLQAILRTTRDGFWAFDTDGNFVDVNNAYCEMSGYTRDEILRLKVSDIDADKRPEDTADRMKRIINTGSEMFQARHRRKDGSIFDAEVSASFLGGEQDRFICFCRDITERMQAEDALKAGRDLLNATQRIAGIGGWEWDVATDTVTWTEELYTITGLDPNFPPPQFNDDHHKIYTKESWQKLTGAVDNALKTGEPYEIFAQMVRPDGELRDVFIHGGSILNNEGAISGLFGIVEDITDKKLREKQLKESEENLRVTLNSIGDAVISTDIDGAIVRMNPVAENLCGWGIDEAKGKALAEVFRIVHADTGEPVENPVAEVLETGKIIGLANHTMLISKDGTKYQIADSAAPIRDGTGRTTGVVLVFRDVTEEYRAAQALADSKWEMARAQEMALLGSWRFDLDSGIVGGSDQARRIYGLDEGELTIDYIQSICLPVYRPKLDAALKALVEEGTPYDVEFQIRRPSDNTVRSIHSVAEYDAEHRRVVGMIQDITERRRAEDKLRGALKEKEFLMQELNHRVKNNLAMVSSLISLRESETAADYSNIKHQVSAISLIHEKLYQAGNVTEVYCRDYIGDLLSTIFTSFAGRQVKLEANIDAVSIPTKSAMPLGLIINEIATNAIKYGFNEKESALFSVTMKEDRENNRYELILLNTGNPFPEDVDIENPQTLGFRLISALTEQLGGSIDLKRRPYPVFTIRFPHTEITK
ncbi:MAG: PAS domain S-box protein [Spirochaetia bacterium]